MSNSEKSKIKAPLLGSSWTFQLQSRFSELDWSVFGEENFPTGPDKTRGSIEQPGIVFLVGAFLMCWGVESKDKHKRKI